LRKESVFSTAVPILAETRCSVVLVPRQLESEATILRYPGHGCTSEGKASFLASWRSSVSAAAVACIAGSLAPGLPDDFYVDLIYAAHQAGLPVVLDCYGDCLRSALAAAPDFVKTNQLELEDLCGHELKTTASQFKALTWICDGGARSAILTLGSRGSLALWMGRRYRVSLKPCSRPRNPIGAGDAFMAGLCDAILREDRPVEAMRWASAVAYASVSAMTSGRLAADPREYHRYIQVTEVSTRGPAPPVVAGAARA
jgi:tagatose 6-phosphate kinase